VVLLIDKTELLEQARKRNLTLAMVEKDYVLGWLLFGLTQIKGLVFKGGTALSKLYFPEVWRLSEDLDFVFSGDFSKITSQMNQVFHEIERQSGIKMVLKSQFSNPEYLQLKIQYQAVLGKNWIKVDVTTERALEVVERPLKRMYSDYPSVKIRVESAEEIAAEKLRALIERKKSRDFFDVWKLMELVDQRKTWNLFLEKCKVKGIEFSMEAMFPSALEETLAPYWERELGRLVYPVPELSKVLRELREWIEKMTRV